MADTSDPTARALKLLALLQQRPTWSGTELAERLGTTTRTVRRDIDRLRGLGYPVNATQGAAGGYQLGAGRALPPLLLDDSEAVAVAVSLRLAAGGTVAGATEAALRALAKLDQVLPARLRSRVRGIHDSISMLPGLPGGLPSAETVDPDALVEIAGACRDRTRLTFAYADRSGVDSSRRVEPYGLVATGRRWYLMGFDLDREDWRTFRLDRMVRVRTSTWRFDRREHEDPATFVQRAVTSSPYRHQIRVRFHAPAETIQATFSPRSSAVEPESDNTCIFTTGGDDLERVATYLGLAGHDFDVLEPRALTEHCAAVGRRFLRASDPAG